MPSAEAVHALMEKVGDAGEKTKSKTKAAIDFSHQSERLGQYVPGQEDETTGSTQAVEANFVTPQDPVIQTMDGGRLPAVPVEEAIKLNKLRDVVDKRDPSQRKEIKATTRESRDGTKHGAAHSGEHVTKEDDGIDAPLRDAKPPSRTNPLFPPMPLYGPPTPLRRIHCWTFRVSSAVLSFLFLVVIILGAAFTSIPLAAKHVWFRITLRDPNSRRPFFKEEKTRRKARRIADKAWASGTNVGFGDDVECDSDVKGLDDFAPLEGGPDPVTCDVRYYARRVGLDCEIFEVQTEDGFIIELWHLYNPKRYQRTNPSQRMPHGPDNFQDHACHVPAADDQSGEKRYPVLMIHGLLQSAGAFCTNDDDSLAFFLAKSGYDVWLGSNRCGFHPKHSMLKYSDPRMWAWNIRQMGVMDLPALISRVISETGFHKIGLIAHSQGTTQTLVALAKEQRPEIGEKISVFCALAPAAYAGPLIGKIYFKFMRIISPAMFRAIFGIHAFIPFMMTMHSLLPSRLYGAMGYRVFSFLFNWTDDRWEQDLRDRMFQFAPVYVSAESMRWWLGRECFANHKCILATREENTIEDREDEQDDQRLDYSSDESGSDGEANSTSTPQSPSDRQRADFHHHKKDRSRFAWYGPGTPPFALWVCGADDLVDGRRLLRRFERNREPHVDVVHSKVIEGYEHLDVIWAMDAIEKVGKEIREVIWRTAPESARRVCKIPRGCQDIVDFYKRTEEREQGTREVDTTAGEWSSKGAQQVSGGGGEGHRDLEAEVAKGEKMRL
ncbi:alpha/beta-hydrolase [Aaosphaeria arxii CBS 175.79]|uniref:Alpha/beta-hydrolase n=1 Tax=Aaosphaeria arxii CBS 175.79 TaxID=1450172 RepID=A0A6A5XJN3_9PLEO|nr:alpha/beta-hydrolase [Aaosphaeria arxii CBS 175.79]KAF2013096.1 alpha/beta-hydrolase [Aaosphaeria arxii CBS 175.79]